MSRGIRPLLISIPIALALCASIVAQTSQPATTKPAATTHPAARPATTRPAPPARKGAAIKEAIAQLIEEAQKIQRDQRLSKTKPDFVARCNREIPADELIKAIITPCHKDQFVDAYVRWQLTGFNPALPPLSDQQMLALQASAPAMIDNPRTNEAAVTEFEKAEKVKNPLEDQTQHWRDAADEIEYRTRVADELNVPAEGWRDWIGEKLPAKGPRRLQWLVERCAATISAGRPVRTVKTRMTKEFKAAGGDSLETLTAHDRELVAEQARRLVGLKRRAINQITFRSDGSLSVTFTSNAVDADDVEKWITFLQPAATQR